MFRKITLVAVPAMALILMACGTDSSAFAKGGSSGRGRIGGRYGFSHNNRGFNRNFGHYHRYGWGSGYGDYGYVEPVVEVPVVAPACTTPEVAPVTQVAPIFEPVVSVVTPEYVPYWGYRNYYRNYRHGEFSGRGGYRGEHRGGRGR